MQSVFKTSFYNFCFKLRQIGRLLEVPETHHSLILTLNAQSKLV